jgi:serine/threonine-protein kinase
MIHSAENAPTLVCTRRTTPVAAPPAELTPGMHIGRYLLEELRYEGGFACLYRAVDTTSGQVRALKVLHRHLLSMPEALARLRLEAETLNQLRHPHIVQILDCGEIDGRPFIAMEWLEGRNLGEELERVGPFSAAETLALMEELCSALGAAHERGIVHRDVKAQNIVAIPQGTWFTLKLVDFGVAKLLDRDVTRRGLTTSRQIVGTPLTMAPEQILGEPVDARTDIYALGLLLYQLLTGRLPFVGATLVETEELHLQAPPPRVSEMAGVGPGIDAVLRRSLEKSRERRPGTVRQFLAELREAVAPTAAPARPLSVGLYARACLLGPPGDQADAALDEVSDLLAEARTAIRLLGLTPAIEVADAVLAVAPMPEGPAEAARFRRRLLEEALALVQRSSGTHARLQITIHLASASIQQQRGRPILGGDLLRLGEWTSGHPGVVATAPVLHGLADCFATTPLSPEGSQAVHRRL